MSTGPVNSDAVAFTRAGLIAVGLGLLAFGGYVFLVDNNPSTYPGIATWLAGAIILHDGVGAMAVFGVTVLTRRAGGIPFAVRAILQGAAAIGVLVAVLVAPEIIKQAIGTANPSVLPLDYVRNLLLFEAGLVVATVVAIVVTLAVRRRAAARTGARTP